MFGSQQRILDKLDRISESVGDIKGDVSTIRSTVGMLDRRGTTGGLERSQTLAESVDKVIHTLNTQELKSQDQGKKVDKLNKFIFGGGAFTGAGGLIAYFNGVFG